MKKLVFSLALMMFLLSSTCRKDEDCPEDYHNDIEIKNNSSITINWQLFELDSVYILNGTPYDKILLPNQSTLYGIRGETCWEAYFKVSTEYFLIFDNDTVQAIGWQQISGTNRGLLKRYKVDLDYLQNNNYSISYP